MGTSDVLRKWCEGQRLRFKKTQGTISGRGSTICYGIWSTGEQGKLNFQLEAAKSIMQAPSLKEGLDRLTFLNNAFPERLPKGFFTNADAADKQPNPPNTKIDFLKLLASKEGLTAEQIRELWITLFPYDDWAEDKQFIQKLHEFSAKPTTDKP